jgi:hypothetical protein
LQSDLKTALERYFLQKIQPYDNKIEETIIRGICYPIYHGSFFSLPER